MIALFFDTETTGFKTKDFIPEIVQIGALLQDTNSRRVLGEFNAIIKPRHSIPEKVTAIHGITDELAATFGVPSVYAEGLFTHLADRADVIVAHNIAFDVDILSGVWPVAYGVVTTEKEQFCTMLNSTEICGLTGTHAGKNKHPKLKEAYKHFFGVEPDNQHDAMSDVRACRDVFFKLHELAA